MRWLVALATAWFLLGAGTTRVEIRGQDAQQDTQLVVPAHGAGHVTARRDGSRGDLRLGAFVVPERVAGIEPPPARLVERTVQAESVAEVAAPEPVSRGPPRG
jgi:hypothetical protein